MKRVVLLGLVILAIGPASVADQESHRAAAYRVLESSQARKTLEQVEQIFENALSQRMASLNLPPEAEQSAEETQAELTAAISDLFEWDEMSEFLMTTWVEVFSEAELLQLAEFYESELGQKLLERQPKIMQKSMEWGQQKMRERMPAFAERVEQAARELEERFENTDSPES